MQLWCCTCADYVQARLTNGAEVYPSRCYWTYLEDGTAHFIPECWGGINGPDHCTCKAPRSQIEALEAENARLRQTVQNFENARGQSDSIRA